MHPARLILIGLGLVLLGISLLPLGFAVLGFLGILSDVSPAENQQFGFELLGYGLPLACVGAALCGLGLAVFRKPIDRHDV